MSITITESAASILDALHCGCTITIHHDRNDVMDHAVIEPYFVAPVQSFLDEDEWALERVDRTGDRYSDRMVRIDREKQVRLDRWSGDADMNATLRDVAMLARGNLISITRHGGIRIADAGRAIAQARVGDGVQIDDDQAATPVSVEPNPAFKIGNPEFFDEMQRAKGDPQLVLYSRVGKPAFSASCDHHVAWTFVEPAVARTIAGMMADAGKVQRDTSATFGSVKVTLHYGGDVSFTFGNQLAVAAARISKIQAKAAKAYLVELAKGAETKATLDPADVDMRIRYLVSPQSLGSWGDIPDDDDEGD